MLFTHVPAHHSSKLDPLAIKYVFLGYSSTKKGISVIIQSHENCLLLRMSFKKKKKIALLTNTTLQGENLREDHFLETSHLILDNPPKFDQPFLSPPSQHLTEPIVSLEKSITGKGDDSQLADHQLKNLCIYSQ